MVTIIRITVPGSTSPSVALSAVSREGKHGTMPDYVFELRRGDAVLATGRLLREPSLEVGDRLTIGGHEGIVRTIQPQLGQREFRLVVQLSPDKPATD